MGIELGIGSMKRFLFVLLMMICSVSRAEWEFGFSTDNDEFSVYHDKSTIRRKGSIVKMWTMKDFSQVQNQAADTYMSSKVMYAFDCKQETAAIISFSRHTESMGGGIAVYSHTVKEKDWNWNPIAPGSVDEGSWKIACGKK